MSLSGWLVGQVGGSCTYSAMKSQARGSKNQAGEDGFSRKAMPELMPDIVPRGFSSATKEVFATGPPAVVSVVCGAAPAAVAQSRHTGFLDSMSALYTAMSCPE